MIYDLDELKAAAANRIEELLSVLLPNAKKKGSTYRVGNIRGEPGDSMSISVRANNAGSFYDHADPSCKGSIFDLIMQIRNLNYKESVKWLAGFCNIPPIQDFSPPARARNPEELARTLKPLTEKARKYITEVRGISLATADAYGLKSGNHGDILFPHYDNEGGLCLLKHWMADETKNIWTNENPIHTLFGKDVCDPEKCHARLIITEGQWDALALYEMGYPAVSIPSGVANFDWINQDYEYLSQFLEILLIFDNDECGKACIEKVVSRLGKGRCLKVTVPGGDDPESPDYCKDPNDILRKGRKQELVTAIESAEAEPLAEIIEANSMREGVRRFLRGEHLTAGPAFFLPGFDLHFRPHEITLWFGYTTHGKSCAIQNQVASLVAQGHMAVVASFEQPPDQTLGAILLNYAAYPNLPYTDWFDPAFDFMSSQVFMYGAQERTNVHHLLNTFIHAHRRYGVTNFFIDNVMTLDIDRGDNTAQANAADTLRIFAAKYPVHVHVVAHPRKPPEFTNKPPQLLEIRGASEWGDMPQNIIAVWRDTLKTERIEEMKADGFSADEIREYYKAIPCSKFVCRKQRATGLHPTRSAWFHIETKRFTLAPEDPHPMYEVPPWQDA